ncbi:MAG TPA: bifunctional (p)ppGpp synthetase/guanosine-3',5'-bis(diphosphate) 3'-pyrophosphohydrolase [Candidatus Acidoferrales bacterium]|nr:bifunctional (p)ppGpp synthetase/guanosine-3',5'-bis(diphosphate) 3'-pyrophosphohydrolase [Candidatus Acidoferrales bacterium]
MANQGKPYLVNRSAEQKLAARFEELAARVTQQRPGSDIELLRRAFDFAAEQHRGQLRQSGEAYMTHPLEVAHLLADMRLDVTALCGALLHDVVEDTKIPIEQIRERFGEEVARLVAGVTKISRLDLRAPETRQAENVRKVLLAMVDDVRVVLVKLADRLHNMRTLEFLPAEKQQRIARETLDIYSPIAHRLGMGLIRHELEDRAFRFLEPESSADLEKRVASKSKTHEKFLAEVQQMIRETTLENGIPAEVQGRIKGLFSLHVKIERQQRPLDQVFDLLAVRVITDTVRNCYAALGVIHQIWRPVPGRFKDYIAMPRPNLYQSLHTTVIHSGQPFEVQIRTQEMHRIAEQGVAAHWKYKDGKTVASGDDQRIVWMRQLIEWVQEMQEPAEFLSTLRVDLYPEEVYTFTPKGKVIPLARGATPVDFAYAVHTEVGNQCVGARVNGQMVTLRHPLSNGDVVEIITQKNHTPSRDWLSFVRSSRARSKIRHWINLHERDQATDLGRKLLEKEARNFGVSLKRINDEAVAKVAPDYGCSRAEDLYAALGYGKFSPRQALQKILGEPLSDTAPEAPPKLVTAVKKALGLGEPSIQVHGHDDLLVFRAKCCNPIPGDEIVGYITRGRGVAVHNRSCPNVQNLLYESERRMDVEWTGAVEGQFVARLLVLTEDRPGMLAEITAAISDAGANIRSLETHQEELPSRTEIALEIKDRRQLDRILVAIKRKPGVFNVERVYKA